MSVSNVSDVNSLTDGKSAQDIIWMFRIQPTLHIQAPQEP